LLATLKRKSACLETVDNADNRLEYNKDVEYEDVEWTEWAIKTEKQKNHTKKMTFQ
jgi:hypothetical protein